MGGEIEGDGEPFLPGSEVLSIKCIGFPGHGKTGVLSDGPGFAGVHGGYGTADIGRDTGEGVDVFHPLQVFAV
jgi:hypothetical protein